jgi:hypothetical protein
MEAVISDPVWLLIVIEDASSRVFGVALNEDEALRKTEGERKFCAMISKSDLAGIAATS